MIKVFALLTGLSLLSGLSALAGQEAWDLTEIAVFPEPGDNDPLLLSPAHVAIVGPDEIVVADNGTTSILRLKLDGSVLGSYGRAGQGPGEFGSGIGALDADDEWIVAHDPAGARLNWFGVGGEVFSKVLGLEAPSMLRIAQRGTTLEEVVTPNGIRSLVQRTEENAQTVMGYAELGSVVESFPRLTPSPIWTTQGDTLVLGRPGAYGVDFYSIRSGERVGGWSQPVEASPSSSRFARRFIRAMASRDGISGDEADDLTDTLVDRVSLGDDFPVTERILAGPDGGILVKRGLSLESDLDDMTALFDAWWDVVDPNGRIIGRFHTPYELAIHDAASGLLAGIMRDELGRSFVHVYRLSPTGTASDRGR